MIRKIHEAIGYFDESYGIYTTMLTCAENMGSGYKFISCIPVQLFTTAATPLKKQTLS
jgi:hypothetical protein